MKAAIETREDAGSFHEGTLTISREFAAPRDLVFRAWTEPGSLARWWGPVGMTLEVRGLDPRPGGFFHFRMGSPDGFEMWARFEYREVSPPERLVYVSAFSDAERRITRAPFFDGRWPLEVLHTITFAEDGDRTTVTLRAEPLGASAAEQAAFVENFLSMEQGFGGTFEQLVNFLKGEPK